MKQLTKNFHRSEFDCKDGTVVPLKYKNNLIKLAANLQVIRDSIQDNHKWSIIINSGYRTESHNKIEGGAKYSQHLIANAGDLFQEKYTPLGFYRHIETLIKQGKVHNGGLFLYNNFVHYDVREKPTRGNYSTLYKL